MRRLITTALLALTLAGCATATPTVSGTLRTPPVSYSTPGQR